MTWQQGRKEKEEKMKKKSAKKVMSVTKITAKDTF